VLQCILLQRRFQALAEREAQLQKAREEHKQYGAWLVEAHQQQAAETARLQALAATLAAQEEQMRVLVLQVGSASVVAVAPELFAQNSSDAGLVRGILHMTCQPQETVFHCCQQPTLDAHLAEQTAVYHFLCTAHKRWHLAVLLFCTCCCSSKRHMRTCQRSCSSWPRTVERWMGRGLPCRRQGKSWTIRSR
jgi:hypothetical protein